MIMFLSFAMLQHMRNCALKDGKGFRNETKVSQSQLGAILVNGSNGWLRSRSMSLVCNHSTPCDVSVF